MGSNGRIANRCRVHRDRSIGIQGTEVDELVNKNAFKPEKFDEICDNCALTYGSHCSDNEKLDMCPGHESRMDWDKGAGTFFIGTGEFGRPPPGQPAFNLPK